MAIITNQDFANEVKSDRLKNLSRVTLFIAGLVFVGIISFGQVWGLETNAWLIGLGATVLLSIGASVTLYLLRHHKRFDLAAWAYTLSWMVSLGVLLGIQNDFTHQLVPYIFPVITFVIGLLLSPVQTLLISILATAIIVIAPMIGSNMPFGISTYQFFAILLMYLSVVLATQVTGELYQITQWALMNYQKERKTNDELFEKRQALQKSLRRSEALGEKLTSANAMAEEAKNFRGQFLANMSHELRTPLNAIIGFSETMLKFPIMYDEMELPSPYARDMNQIFDSGRQLLHVINDILDLAKVDAGKLELHIEEVNTEPIINAVLSTARGLLGAKKIQLERDTPEIIPTVLADESRLRQVLLNLYSNACKYTDEGFIKLTASADDKEVTFTVSDSGRGIAQEFHDTLFEEFTQADNVGRDPHAGSGLGLAITRQLLGLMKGRIWLESEEGKGSTFSFVLPRYETGTSTTDGIQSLESNPSPASADTDSNNLSSVQTILQSGNEIT